LAERGDHGYRPAERDYAARAPAYSADRPLTAHGRYGMRYSGYGGAPGYAAGGGYGGAVAYGDGRGEPRLIGRGDARYGFERDADDRSYGGGPLLADRRGGYPDFDGGDPRYAFRRDDGGYAGGYDRRYGRGDHYEGSNFGYAPEPYGYRGGRGYAGPYGYGYDRGDAEGVHYLYDGGVDRFSGFVAPPPHDSREARELRDYCGCDDEGY